MKVPLLIVPKLRISDTLFYKAQRSKADLNGLWFTLHMMLLLSSCSITSHTTTLHWQSQTLDRHTPVVLPAIPNVLSECKDCCPVICGLCLLLSLNAAATWQQNNGSCVSALMWWHFYTKSNSSSVLQVKLKRCYSHAMYQTAVLFAPQRCM